LDRSAARMRIHCLASPAWIDSSESIAILVPGMATRSPVSGLAGGLGQAVSRSRVMRGQDRQAWVVLAHLVDHGSGLPQVTPVPGSGHVAGLKHVRVVGHVADHHQRRQARPADRSEIDPGVCPGVGSTTRLPSPNRS